MTGKVKWFNTFKGYGFIVADTGEEFFVHHSDVRLEGPINLKIGQKVDFEIGTAPNGNPTAINVSLL